MRRAQWILVLAAVLVTALLAATGCEDWYKPGQPPEEAPAVSAPLRPMVSATPEPESAESEQPAESEPTAVESAATEAESEPTITAENEAGPETGPETVEEPVAAEPSTNDGVTLTQVVAMNVQQAAVDCRVVRSHIETAQTLLAQNEGTRARVAIQQAIRSAAFVRAGLPSVQAVQCLERAIQESERGRTSAATDAVEAAIDVSAEVTLRGTVAEFQRRGSQGIEKIRSGDLELARELLLRMQEMIVPSESEYTASRISDHLLGALSALDRDAVRPAVAELTDADEKALALVRILEGVG